MTESREYELPTGELCTIEWSLYGKIYDPSIELQCYCQVPSEGCSCYDPVMKVEYKVSIGEEKAFVQEITAKQERWKDNASKTVKFSETPAVTVELKFTEPKLMGDLAQKLYLADLVRESLCSSTDHSYTAEYLRSYNRKKGFCFW